MRMRNLAGVSTLAVAVWVGSAGVVDAARPPRAAAVDATRLLAAGADPANWITHGGTYAEQRFADLDQINSGNAGQLGLAWSYDLDTNRGQEGTPLVIDGTLYTTTAWSKVVALDAATGKEKWTYDPEVPMDRGQAALLENDEVGGEIAAVH